MNVDQDLEKIALQEKRLKFKYSDSEVAWALGTALKVAAEKRHVAVWPSIFSLTAIPFFHTQ